MVKYDSLMPAIQQKLSVAKNILIALPAEVEVDDLAAGLALFLSLEQSGKTPYILSEGVIRVGHTNLFGVGEVQNKLPEGVSGGNFQIVLGGVVASDGTVPTLQKLDWAPEGNDLKLVFHVLPGKKFEPTHVTPNHLDGLNYDLLFVIGADSLEQIGSVYTNNQSVFSQSFTVNIDHTTTNSKFGQAVIVDSEASSNSEIVGQLITPLSLSFEGDIATNVLSGIYSATNNLQTGKLSAVTFETIANAVKVGGKIPGIASTVSVGTSTQPVSDTVNIASTSPAPTPSAFSSPGIDLSSIFQTGFSTPAAPVGTSTPLVATSAPINNTTQNQPSQEERPSGEQATSGNPELDWLTPKIYKGSSIG